MHEGQKGSGRSEKRTKIFSGFGDYLRQDLEEFIAQVEGKELKDSEIELAMKNFIDRVESLSNRVLSGAAITRAIESVTEAEVEETGEVTEIRFGDVPLAANMIMVAFD